MEHAPEPVLGTDGRWHLVYEIYLLNTAPVPQEITIIEVRAARDARIVLRYATPERIRAVTATSTTEGGGVDELAPNAGGVVFVDLAAATKRALPKRIVHHIETRIGSVALTLDGAPTQTSTHAAVRIGPPLVGGGYLNENGCCGRSDHTRALLTIEGARWLAQRFAIDWVRLDAQGRPYVGDFRVNENWYIFGDPIVSVSGGRVVETLDTMPENTPPVPASDLTPYTALGNHVIVDMGEGRFALYAHMQPGSVAVTVGERVRRGQLLGRVGNTGSSAAPHLHFHITDGAAAVASNGAPWVFDRFQYVARALNADAVNADEPALRAVLEHAPPPRWRTMQMPLQGDVVDFAGSREAVLAGGGQSQE
ncbi:MAG: M23 family metallopeptidase [Nitrococcus sp.]|nr:M23 family metallopeptidase [Nitrococcus sp.]